MTEKQQQYQRRSQIIDTLWPAVAYLQTRSAVFEFQAVDLEIGRRLFLERATGVQEDGRASVFFSTLEEGQAPSLSRLAQVRELVNEGIDDLLSNPDRYGITVLEDDIEEE